MAWYDFWKKKPVKAVAKVPAVEAPSAGLKVLDYPKSKYKVYWETHLFEQPAGDWVAEVRFIGYNGYDHRTNHAIGAPTRASALSLAEKLIVEKMSDYKR